MEDKVYSSFWNVLGLSNLFVKNWVYNKLFWADSRNQSPAPLLTWVKGTWYTQSGMGTYEQPGHTRYQVTRYLVRVVTGYWYSRKTGDQVPGVPK